MREICSYGSVRGALGNQGPYRDSQNAWTPPEPIPLKPEKAPDPLPDLPLEFKINPEFTYLTPEKAAKAATLKKVA